MVLYPVGCRDRRSGKRVCRTVRARWWKTLVGSGFACLAVLAGLAGVAQAEGRPVARSSSRDSLFNRDAHRAFVESLDPASQRRAVRLKARVIVPGHDAALVAATTPQHIYAQFTQPPSPAERAELEQLGIQIRDYVTNRTYVVECPAGGADHLLSHPLVEGVAAIQWEDKLAPHLWRILTSPAPEETDSLPFTCALQVYAGVPVEEVRTHLQQQGIPATVMPLASTMVLQADLTLAQVAHVAQMDAIAAVHPVAIERIPHNANAQVYTRSDVAQAPPYDLDGTGIVVLVRDEGRAEHADFSARVTQLEPVTPLLSDHHTHVTGTVAGSGVGNANAEGMAPNASVVTYDFDAANLAEDVAEIRDAYTGHGAKLSNHSYGYIEGWAFGGFIFATIAPFGEYGIFAQAWDELVFTDDLVIVKSAGNDRDDFNASTLAHGHLTFTDYFPGPFYDSHPSDCSLDGAYNCINGEGIGKNVITVGAVDHTNVMSTFSSFGPALDGRVKPDVVSDGVNLFSTWPGNSYYTISGTSMSAPATTGSLALFMQYYRDNFGGGTELPSAALTKACLIHGARDLDPTHGTPFYQVGPDYASGYGAVDVVNSIDSLHDAEFGPFTVFVAGSVSDFTWTFPVFTSGEQIKVTLAWTDPAGNPAAASAIVNDLDVRVIAPDGSTHLPWVLDPLNPSQAATRGDNSVDTVEQVVIDAAPSGIYSVTVTSKAIPAQDQPFAIILPTSSCDVTVTSPNGGERYQPGDTVPVTWTSTGGDLAVVLLRRDGATFVEELRDTPVANDGAHSLALPGTLPAGDYRVRVEEAANAECFDESDADFQVVLPCDVVLTSPNGGERFEPGDSMPVTWTGGIGDVAVVLLRWDGAAFVEELRDTPVLNDGSHTLVLPGALERGKYRVRVEEVGNPDCFDRSDADFDVIPPCSLGLTSPNGGEVHRAGSLLPVTWTGGFGDLELVLLQWNGTAFVEELRESPVTNDGIHEVALPPGLAVGQYRVQLIEVGDDTCLDESDANFEIIPPCDLAVASPSGGEAFRVGKALPVTWTGGVGDLDLVLQRWNGTAFVEELRESPVTNDGAHAIPLPLTLPAGQYRVRLIELGDSTCSDDSNANFEIISPCDIAITSPNGGETYRAGNPLPVTWTGGFGDLDLVLLRWTGVAFVEELRESSLANDGAHAITLPPSLPPGQYRLRAIEQFDPACVDESNGDFTIIPLCGITLTSPNGGERFEVGNAVPVTWTGGLGDVALVLLRWTGATFIEVVRDTPVVNDGSHAFLLPESLAAGAYRLRIEELGDSTCLDTSDANFQLVVCPTPGTVANVMATHDTFTDVVQVSWDVVGLAQRYRVFRAEDTTLPVIPLDNVPASPFIDITAIAGVSYRYWVQAGVPCSDGSWVWGSISGPTAGRRHDGTCTLAFTSPTSQIYVRGEVLPIRWTGETIERGTVQLQLFRRARGGWRRVRTSLFTEMENIGSFDWPIPAGIPTGRYMIRIQDARFRRACRLNSPEFQIADCTLHLLAPEGGEVFAQGETVPIMWEGTVKVGRRVTVILQRRTQRGWRTVARIAETTPNDGSHDWIIPADVRPGRYRILIVDATSPRECRERSGVFRITRP